MLAARRQSGDTIIEVAIAFVVFSLLAVGASMVMNRGMASAQESLETTLVRQEMDAQAETLRYLHQQYINDFGAIMPNTPAATFQTIIGHEADRDATLFGDSVCLTGIPDSDGRHPFLLRPNEPKNIIEGTEYLHPISHDDAPAGYATREADGHAYGLWIEAVEGADDGVAALTRFYDFHIRACWYGLTSDAPRTLGTIVRLYVPYSS